MKNISNRVIKGHSNRPHYNVIMEEILEEKTLKTKQQTIQNTTQREKKELKKKRTSVSSETASTSQIHNKTGILKGEESKVGTGKVCEELMGKISKSDENHKPHASKLNELHKKHEKNYSKAYGCSKPIIKFF